MCTSMYVLVYREKEKSSHVTRIFLGGAGYIELAPIIEEFSRWRKIIGNTYDAFRLSGFEQIRFKSSG